MEAAPEKIRAFIAIFPPAEIVERIATTQREFKKRDDRNAVNWTKAEHIHLTLKFLGSISAANVSKIQNALATICRRSAAMELTVRGLGAFPNLKRPRVLWAGVEGDIDALLKLQKQIDDTLRDIAPCEERAFHPHLTIGRVRAERANAVRGVIGALEKHSREEFGTWRALEVHLMQSELSSSGARYRSLFAVRFGISAGD